MSRSDQPIVGILSVALLLQIGTLVWYAAFFRAHGYLPEPFPYHKFDTFMDIYNPLWWNTSDKYVTWGTVYPPLNFLILDAIHLVSFGDFQFENAIDMRDTSIMPAVLVTACYLVAPAVIVSCGYWRSVSSAVRMLVAGVATLSPVMLFSIERANLIVLALLLLPLVFSSRPLLQAVGIAVAINLKPYFALLLIIFLIARQWREFLLSFALAGAIFVFTGLACDPDFLLFVPNLLNFSQSADVIFSGRELMALPSSISAFSNVLLVTIRNYGDPTGWLSAAATAIEVVKNAGLAVAFATIITAGRHLDSKEIAAAIIVVIVNLGVWVGGYSQIFLIPCIPAFFIMRLRWFYLATVLILFLPLDQIKLFTEPMGYFASYLSWTIPSVDWSLSLGAVLRPVLNFILMLVISAEFFVRGFPSQSLADQKVVTACPTSQS
jgi:hypothetical protein